MLGDVCHVGERCDDLITSKLIVLSDILNGIARSKPSDDGGHVNLGASNTGLPNRIAGSIVIPG
jgi:hypothetical protein